jgi:hypothetical protein
LNVENVLEIYFDALKNQQKTDNQLTDDIQSLCIEFTKEHLNDVVNLPKINYLPKDVFLIFLKDIA